MKNKGKAGTTGFTMIELMIVAGIIGILMAIALPRYGDMIEKANHGATLGNIAAIRSAISIYYGANSSMPENLDINNKGFKSVMGNRLPGVKVKYPFLHPPYGNNVHIGTDAPDSSGTGWYYNYAKGYVYINSTENDVYSKCYTIY